MSYIPLLEEFDRDGAIQETAATVDPETRGSFLKKAGIGAGALLGGGAVLGALPSLAGASSKVAASDVAILNYALTLEYLEAAFYAEAVKKGRFSGKVGKFARVVSAHENAHVAFLKGALGSKAIKSPKFDFGATVTDRAMFQQTAQVLEDTGVTAYLGQVANISKRGTLTAAATIALVEGRHAAWIRFINGGATLGTPISALPAPNTFDKPKSERSVLNAVKDTGFIQ